MLMGFMYRFALLPALHFVYIETLWLIASFYIK